MLYPPPEYTEMRESLSRGDDLCWLSQRQRMGFGRSHRAWRGAPHPNTIDRLPTLHLRQTPTMSVAENHQSNHLARRYDERGESEQPVMAYAKRRTSSSGSSHVSKLPVSDTAKRHMNGFSATALGI
jgi:hypothetical protein